MSERQSTVPAGKSPVGTKGYTGNPGGRPKVLREIERMINAKHRTPAQVEKALDAALEFGTRGDKGDAAYLKLWLERIVGPVKELDDLDDLLKDAPPEVLAFLRTLH